MQSLAVGTSPLQFLAVSNLPLQFSGKNLPAAIAHRILSFSVQFLVVACNFLFLFQDPAAPPPSSPPQQQHFPHTDIIIINIIIIIIIQPFLLKRCCIRLNGQAM